MSKGHPYRYEQGPGDRIRGRFAPPESRREIGSPYKRQRRSSGSENFTSFSYDDTYIPGHRHQEVGLGNFTDFSAISRDTVLERESKHNDKPTSGSKPVPLLSIQTPSSATIPPTSKISPLAVKVSPTPPNPDKPSTPRKSNSLLSSFRHTEQPFPQRSCNQPPSSPYRSAQRQPMQFSPRAESNPNPAHNIHGPYPTAGHTGQPTGLLIQASSVDVVPSYIKATPVTPTKDEVYQPKVEAVSPSNSENEVEKNVDETPKEDLLKHMEKVDKEIAEVEKKIIDLKEKQRILEEELAQEVVEPKQVEEQEHREEKENEKENKKENEKEKKMENGVKEDAEVNATNSHTFEPKEKTLIERIYEENRRKAAAAHQQFAKIGIPLPNSLPLYNQPSDLPIYEENRKKAKAVQLKLIKCFQWKRKEKQREQRKLLEEYRALEKTWLEKVEKLENTPKRKNKESRFRDFYEKVFPEIKRQREQTERFSRLGSRTNWGLAARSEAEYNEILKDLTEKETHEKHMRDLAVDPPTLLDSDQRRVKFINKNGLIQDLRAYVNERKMLNVWTEKEKEIFKEKYIEAPKDFDFIAKFLDNKNVKDCVLYYYRTKRTGKYKKLARKQSLKRKRLPNSSTKEEGTKSKILKSRTDAYRSDSDNEEDEAYDEDTDGSEESSTKVPLTTTPSATQPARVTTSQISGRPEPVETPRWSKSEREIAIEGLRLHGRNWTAIAHMVRTKTDAQCKNFYFNYKKKLDLEAVVAQHSASKIQRQESEETISASEVSDDGLDGHNEDKVHSVSKPKQYARETRSQTADKRVEISSGPTLRNLRPQRSSRTKPSEPKTCVLPRNRASQAVRETQNASSKITELEKTAESPEPPKTNNVEFTGLDERRIVVDDIGEGEGDEEHDVTLRDAVVPHEYSGEQDLPVQGHVVTPAISSSAAGITPSRIAGPQRNLPAAPTLRLSPPPLVREPVVSQGIDSLSSANIQPPATVSVKATQGAVHSSLPSAGVDLPQAKPPAVSISSTSSSCVYPDVPYRTILVDTPVGPPSTHTQALLNITKNMASSAGPTGTKMSLEDSDNESQREKVKNISRPPDPQLPKVEQKEAIGIFSRFSPCIPPDATSRPQVRTQRFPPPPPLHPTSSLMPSFGPHIGPHGAYYVPHGAEMFPIGPGYPPLMEYFSQSGLDPEHLVHIPPFSAARFMDDPFYHASALWHQHFDRRRMFVGHPSTHVMNSEMNRLTPPEGISRRKESIGHETNPNVPSTRCRSVETAITYTTRVRTPEHNTMSDMRPGIQQRSISLSDVHSRVRNAPDERHTLPFQPVPRSSRSPKEQVSDQVKSYEPFNALINVAAGAQPITSLEESGRSAHEHARKPLKMEEKERAEVHFTRQSCVVTNTSVIHAASLTMGTAGRRSPSDPPRYGISTGLARKPPPLMAITGQKKVLSPDSRTGEVLVSELLPSFGMVKEVSPRGYEMVNPRTAISEKLEPRPSHVKRSSPTYIHNPQQPPPFVRSTHTSSLPDRRVVSPEIIVCGSCRGNEPCRHQLYSQGVPYVHRSDNVSKISSARNENDPVPRHVPTASAISVSTPETTADTSSRGSTTLFRPWMVKTDEEKELPKTSKSATPSSKISSLSVERSSDLSRFAASGTTIYPGLSPFITDERGQPWRTSPVETFVDPTKSLRVPYDPSIDFRPVGQHYEMMPYHIFPPGVFPGKGGNLVSRDSLRATHLDTIQINPHRIPDSPLVMHSHPASWPSSREGPMMELFEANPASSRRPGFVQGRLSPVERRVATSSEIALEPSSSDHETSYRTGSDATTDEETSVGYRSSDDEDDDHRDNSDTLSCECEAEKDDEVLTGTASELTGTSDPGELTSYHDPSESDDMRSKTVGAGTGDTVVKPSTTFDESTSEVDERKDLREQPGKQLISNTDGISTTQSGTTFLGFSDSSWADDNVVSSRTPSYGTNVQRAPDDSMISGDSTTGHVSDAEHICRNWVGEESDNLEMEGGGTSEKVKDMSDTEDGEVVTDTGEVVSGGENDAIVSDTVEGGVINDMEEDEVVCDKEDEQVVSGEDDDNVVRDMKGNVVVGGSDEGISGGDSNEVLSDTGDDEEVGDRADDGMVGSREDGEPLSGTDDGKGVCSMETKGMFRDQGETRTTGRKGGEADSSVEGDGVIGDEQNGQVVTCTKTEEMVSGSEDEEVVRGRDEEEAVSAGGEVGMTMDTEVDRGVGGTQGSDGREENELISGAEDDDRGAVSNFEDNEAVSYLQGSQMDNWGDDNEQGNIEEPQGTKDDIVGIDDPDYELEDRVTSSIEPVDLREVKDDRILSSVRQSDEEEATVVSGTTDDGEEVKDERGTEDKDVDIVDSSGTWEDRDVGVHDEVESSGDTFELQRENHETTERNDRTREYETDRNNQMRNPDSECLSSGGVMDDDRRREAPKDLEGSPVAEQTRDQSDADNKDVNQPRLEEGVADTTDNETIQNIAADSVEQGNEDEDEDGDKNEQDEPCAVSSACPADNSSSSFISSFQVENYLNNETETGADDSNANFVSASDDYHRRTEESSRAVVESSPISSPSISEKRDDVVSTSEISSQSRMSHLDGDEGLESQAESSEVEAARKRTLVDSLSVDSTPTGNLDNRRENDADDSDQSEFSDEPTTTNVDDHTLTAAQLDRWKGYDVNKPVMSENEAESSSMFEEHHTLLERDNVGRSVIQKDCLVDSSTTTVSSSGDRHVKPVSSTIDDQESSEDTLEDTAGRPGDCGTIEDSRTIGDNSLSCVTSASTELDKYDIAVEAISSCDEECSISELEEGEIAETPGGHDEYDVTEVSDHLNQYIPISPPGADDECNISNSSFMEWDCSYVHSTTQPLVVNLNEATGLNELTGTSRISHSVAFPFSALNVRSAPNSNASSPVPLAYASGCSTPVIFHRQGSNTPLSEHYEPLSDDENGEEDNIEGEETAPDQDDD